jgi:excinuclease ABC subunit A
MTVEEACTFFKNHKKIYKKLQLLHETGLSYLTLGQSALTLSGGEAQRLKLSKYLSLSTKGKTLYILDEPSTGLHRTDIQTLLKIIHRLSTQKNPIIIIEHNLDIIQAANYIIDMGPQGGEQGGKIIAKGTLKDIIKHKQSITGQWLKKELHEL